MAASNGLRAQKSVPVKSKRASGPASGSGTPPKNTGRKRVEGLYDGVVNELNRASKEGLPYTGA